MYLHFILVKNAPHKSFDPKNEFSGTVFGQIFFAVHFLLRSNLHFWKLWKDGFFIPHSPLLKNKTLHLLEGTTNTVPFFLRTERSKMQEPLNISKKSFVLDFHSPYKMLCHASKLLNFVRITGLFCTACPARCVVKFMQCTSLVELLCQVVQ